MTAVLQCELRRSAEIAWLGVSFVRARLATVNKNAVSVTD